MDADEALAIVDTVFHPEHLNAVQELVLRQCWVGWTYQEIAENFDYDADYIRGVGSRLWQKLSDALGEKITKSNLQPILRQQQYRKNRDTGAPTSGNTAIGQSSKQSNPKLKNQNQRLVEVELPGGQVPLGSKFYVERPPLESLCYAAVLEPSALIRIKAPRRMGKTSLMARTLAHAREQGLLTIALNFQLADATVFTDLRRFLQWFCVAVGKGLNLPNQLPQLWDDVFSSNYNATDYFENYLLKETSSPVILALDAVDIVFNYPKIATDFFGLLRVWYEKARENDSVGQTWQKLRLIVIYSTEVYIPLHTNQSPFNVGLLIAVPELTARQVQALAQWHGLHWSDQVGQNNTALLMQCVGGNPYLIRVALYYLSQHGLTIEQILGTATTEYGIYTEHLKRQWQTLQRQPDLLTSYRHIITASSAVEVNFVHALKLQSMGLAKGSPAQMVPSCNLYWKFFGDYFILKDM
ncbi:MAG: serine/threonine protein kinase [Cyanothece sp. SIO1E1]|nr:serine/threonine protein kinase [Cyanothece sp. SIO1E1]